MAYLGYRLSIYTFFERNPFSLLMILASFTPLSYIAMKEFITARDT